MDIQKLAGTLLSSDVLSGLSKKSGATKSEVKNVLTQVLPSLLSGAENQAKDSSTAGSFAKALASHAKDDTSDLLGFLKNVNLEDGAKIIGHLLGGSSSGTAKTVSKETGVSASKVSKILSAAAPLLMSLLGQQADEDDDKDSGIGGLMGSLLSNVDLGDLLTGLLKDDDTPAKSKSKKKKSSKKSSDGGVGSLLSGLLGKLLK